MNLQALLKTVSPSLEDLSLDVRNIRPNDASIVELLNRPDIERSVTSLRLIFVERHVNWLRAITPVFVNLQCLTLGHKNLYGEFEVSVSYDKLKS